ncbi:MAG TPA: MerR family transcriptional regulator [Spirochaetia bacterium]|nr:MerR family transcriptional regulator [Spirochaetia bacterium]
MKEYHIGEVCNLLDVKPHVLRYWEQEVPVVSPRKDNFGRRMYSERDLQILMRLKHLLYERGFTIEGARNLLIEEMAGENQNLRARIADIKNDLLSLLNRIRASRE